MFIAMSSQVDRFLETLKSPRTAEGYRHVLAKLTEWLSARGETFTQLTPEAFEEFLNFHPQWHAVSRYLAFNVTRSFLRWMIGEEHPLAGVKKKKPVSKPQPTITQEQFEKIIESFNTMTPIGARDLALFALAAETGLRASALCNLKLRDLHLESLYLDAVDKGREGGKWRRCKISQYVAMYLAAWLAHREQIALPETDTVFCSVYGKKKGLQNNRFGLLSRCREISEKVGFTFTPHVFRRLMATRMKELGASDSLRAAQGGWDSEKEMRKYERAYQIPDITPFSAVSNYYNKKG